MTTDRQNGLFESFVNQRTYSEKAEDRALIVQITEAVRSVLPGAGVRWAGSQYKQTAVKGSDLDMCIESNSPVTESQRRALRRALADALHRPVSVQSHALRVAAGEAGPKVDVCFGNAAFGSRPLPDATEFRDRRARQMAARALKLWIRGSRLPAVPGWAIEALVVHLDTQPGSFGPLELFIRVVTWIATKATPQSVEGVLRPAAKPAWNAAWKNRLGGRLEALQNSARSLLARSTPSVPWSSELDVATWLGCQ